NQLEKRSAIDKTLATQLRQQAWLELLGAQTHDLMALHALWKRVPDEYKQRTKVAALAARAFIKLQDCREAGQILSDSLNARWDSELVALYGDCEGEATTAQIEQAENWLKQHTHDAGLLLALGKLCLHKGLWGKAQSYLDASNGLAPSRAAYAALAQLAEKQGQHEVAARHFQKAMELGQC
ncbi:MAG TPA: heme biosynthesis protein HemY, partial [Gallionellaceae bacterium]|nr:heme biosynthesis protein HemY [Gallionellaceae bacterium]